MNVHSNEPSFLHDINSIRSAACSVAQSRAKLKNFKELSQEERKLLLDIINGTNTTPPSEITEKIYVKLKQKQDFKRTYSFTASISRFFKNLFFNRTSSRDLINAISNFEIQKHSLSDKDDKELITFLSSKLRGSWKSDHANMVGTIKGISTKALNWGEVQSYDKNSNITTIQISKYVAYAKMKGLGDCEPYDEYDVLKYIFDKLPKDDCSWYCDEDENAEIRSKKEETLSKALKSSFPDFSGYKIVQVPAFDISSQNQSLLEYKLEIQPDAVKTFHALHCVKKDMIDYYGNSR